jgi:hypothetical protein
MYVFYTRIMAAQVDFVGTGTGRQGVEPPAHRTGDSSYCRDSAMRISLSVSTMRSPLTSTVTLCRVPVKRNGDW